MSKLPPKPAQKTRIQHQNEQLILEAALAVFSAYGYRGTTVDQIAAKAGLSKPNLLYYFRRKEDIYVAVLEHTLTEWLAPLRLLDREKDPIEELSAYISAKLELSWRNPAASRLFANEILHGAPHIEKYLKGALKELVDEKASVITHWVKEGRMRPVAPHHLIFAIWAVTQHYADFAPQVEALLGPHLDHATANQAAIQILVQGLKPAESH
ncbi:MAG: TetR family transcriptional regulator C-terminal domain-containing protein [Alphaproteobacteria bacterium]|nr:TetR family transcriptional regulator C-terminal domain-containing protein [Alphaproteobacteria bacterium]